MESGERSFSRGDGRSRRRSGNRIPDIEEGIDDILRVYGTEERDGRLFWLSLKSATSKAAVTGCTFYGIRRKESPIAETST